MVKKTLYSQRADVPEKDKDDISTQTDTVSMSSTNAAAFVVWEGDLGRAPDVAFHI